MSTDAHAQPAGHGGGHAPHLTVKGMFVIYFALLGLMVLTIVAALIDMGAANFLIAMGIATVKMVLIVLYFMHVRYSPKLTWVFSTAAFLWLVILVVGILNDYLTRDTIVPGK